MEYNPKTIWNCKQNKPSLVVDDVMKFVEQYQEESLMDCPYFKNGIYEILLNRGVFKWLSVRRDLIKLKNKWKYQISLSYKLQSERKWCGETLAYKRGYREGLEQARAEVRALCHSQRWRAPDNDRRAQEWLDQQSQSS